MVKHEAGASHELNLAFTPLIEAYVGITNPSLIAARAKSYPIRIRKSYAHYVGLDRAISSFPALFRVPEQELQVSTDDFDFPAAVGEYGSDWTSLCLRTTAALIDSTTGKNGEGQKLVELAYETDDVHADNLERYTHYGFVKKVTPPDKVAESSSLRTFQDGLFTVLTAVNWLTAYKVVGYEDNPVGLTRALVDQHLVSRLALVIPPQLTGEMSGQGIVLMAPTVVVKENGELDINEEIINHFTGKRKDGFYSNNTGGIEDLNVFGCPLARRLKGKRESGIDMSARVLADCISA